MQITKIVSIIGIVGLLTSCSMTLPASGRIVGTKETFKGEATGYLDGGGTLTLTSSRGAVCDGKFVYVSHRDGKGNFNCTDGRAGSFSFVSTGSSGLGEGIIGGKQFIFEFG